MLSLLLIVSLVLNLFLLSAGAGSTLDVPTAGKAVATLLGAKGGGTGKTFQGKAPNMSAWRKISTTPFQSSAKHFKKRPKSFLSILHG